MRSGALLVVDPGRLLSAVEEAFADACDRLDGGAKAICVKRPKRYLDIEIEAAATHKGPRRYGKLGGT